MYDSRVLREGRRPPKVSATSTLMPDSIRWRAFDGLMSKCLQALSSVGKSMPFTVTGRSDLRFSELCSLSVAHRQFSGAYGPFGSSLSIVLPGGLRPMSARNASKDSSHRLQTVMPRPPQFGKSLDFSSWQRLFMPNQVRYSADIPCRFLWPCFVTLKDRLATNSGSAPSLLAHSEAKHPQDRVPPRRRFGPVASVWFPQSQTHSHWRGFWSFWITRSRPNLCPVMSMSFMPQ